MQATINRIILKRKPETGSLIISGLSLFLLVVFQFGFKLSLIVPIVLIAAAGAVCVFLFLIPYPKYAFPLLLVGGLSIPFASFPLFIAGGEGFQWIHLVGLILITQMFIRLFRGASIPHFPALPWIITLLTASIISTLALIDQPDSYFVEFWKSEIQLVFAALFLISITMLRLKPAQIEFIIKSLILLSVAVALFGLYQILARQYGLPGAFIAQYNPSLAGRSQSFHGILNLNRAASIFSEPSYFGRYMVGMVPLSIIAILYKPNLFGPKWRLWLILIIQTSGMLASFSMGSFYLSVLLAALMLLIEPGKQKFMVIRAIVILIALAYACMKIFELISGYPVTQLLIERAIGVYQYIFLANQDIDVLIPGESIHLRVSSAITGLQVWRDNPVYGVGLGSYTLVSSLWGETNYGGFAANTLINTLAEIGIFGFIGLVGFSFSTLIGLWTIFRKKIPVSIDPACLENLKRLQFLARCMFYVIAFEVLYFHVGGSLFQPGIWFYFGMGALITIIFKNKLNTAIKSSTRA